MNLKTNDVNPAHWKAHLGLSLAPPNRWRRRPSLANKLQPKLSCFCIPQISTRLQQRGLTIWHLPALVNKNTRVLRPGPVITVEAIRPIPITIRQPAFPHAPSHKYTRTSSLLGSCQAPIKPTLNLFEAWLQWGAGNGSTTPLRRLCSWGWSHLLH